MFEYVKLISSNSKFITKIKMKTTDWNVDLFDEILLIILSYTSCVTIRSLCNRYQYVYALCNSNHLFFKKIFVHINAPHVYPFSMKSINNLSFFENNIYYEIMCRLLSFNTHVCAIKDETPTVILNNSIIKKERLHELEYLLFKQQNIATQRKKVIDTNWNTNINYFIKQLNNNLYYNDWKWILAKGQWILTGDSILHCLNTKSNGYAYDDHIDLYFIQNRDRDYFDDNLQKCTEYFKTKYKCIESNDKPIFKSNVCDVIHKLYVQIDKKNNAWIQFRFIKMKNCFNPCLICRNFDIDICQVWFDGNNIKCTRAAFRGLQSMSMICYRIKNVPIGWKDSYMHIVKYYYKYGFTWLVPLKYNHSKTMSIDKLNSMQLKTHERFFNEKVSISGYTTEFRKTITDVYTFKNQINFDWFDLNDEFIKKLIFSNQNDVKRFFSEYNVINVNKWTSEYINYKERLLIFEEEFSEYLYENITS